MASTGSPSFQKIIGNNAVLEIFFWGTMPPSMNWMALQAGPHALTGIRGTYNGIANPVFAYDPNGAFDARNAAACRVKDS